MSVKYRIVEASAGDANEIMSITNEAFMADAFFKKPEYILRFRLEEVVAMLEMSNNSFLLARREEADEVIGSLRLEIAHQENSEGNKLVRLLLSFPLTFVN